MGIRHQLPVYSPVTAKASFLAVAQALHLGADPRPELRALLEREYDAQSVLLCGSGTQALTIAIREARKLVDPAAPVALPAFSCFDVATAAVGADARVSFYDIDPDTLGPDVPSLERTLIGGARVVVVAPLYGMPVDWDELRTLALRYGAILIEDAAQGNGANWKGRPLGSLGEITVLSFGRGKGWTGGSGGAVLMRGSAVIAGDETRESGVSREAVSALVLFAQWTLARPALYGIPASVPALQLGQTVYREPTPATTITRASAAALLATREDSVREAEIRSANANQLLATICEKSNIRAISVHREASAGYLRLPIRLPRGMASFDSASEALALGGAPGYPRQLSALTQLSDRIAGSATSFPGAETLVRELVTLPTHSRMKPSDLERIEHVLAASRG